MAMKWAFLGMYCSILYLNHQNVSNMYGFSSNVDWSTQNCQITKAKHKDAIANKLFDVVKKNHNKTNKTSTKTWLAKRKANIIDVTQARKRKHSQPQA
jgi:Zn-finger protein